jgi:hypothetical protein
MRQVEMALEGIYAAKDQYAWSDASDDESDENYFELDDASASLGGAHACTTSHVELRSTPPGTEGRHHCRTGGARQWI